MVANVHELNVEAISMDVLRYRYEPFAEQDAHEFPVYITCDNVERCSNELGDNRLVDVGQVDGRRASCTLLPAFGPGWYGRAAVAYRLYEGIIVRSDLKPC